jgi:hypothetical protein
VQTIEKFDVPADLGENLLKFYQRQATFALENLDLMRPQLSEHFGVYILFYKGTFDLYTSMTRVNGTEFRKPIYIGKAVTDGARTSKNRGSRNSLFKRLREHRTSIEHTENLEPSEFFFRVVAMNAELVDWAESFLISQLKPLWNTSLSGFGIHDPGSGRYNQARSIWDQLHPGRKWAKKMEKLAAFELESLRKAIEEANKND